MPSQPSATPRQHVPGFLPHTLLWQTFLQIALILILSLITWAQIFQYFQEPARTRDLSQMMVTIINLTRTALIKAEPNLRTDLLIEWAALEGINAYPSEPTEDLQPLPDTRPMRLLTDEIRRQLGENTRFAWSREGQVGFWVSFRVDEIDPDDFWVMVPSERLRPSLAVEWLMWGGAALLIVALVSAFLIVSRISSPLRELARSAHLVGLGRIPPKLPANGPQEIATVIQAFNQMTGDLASTDADRTLLLAGVSHDLRTPLARLRLGIEMTGAPESDVLAMVSDIDEMDRIIGQFLDFARGQPQEKLQEIDLVELLEKIIEPYRLRHIAIVTTFPDKLRLHAFLLPLRRAITNLIDNAVRYAGTDKPIDILASEREGKVYIEVADQGPGMPEKEIEYLRQPFTRREVARSGTKGAGLGLAIIDRVMTWHHGRLELLPRPGGGLRAILELPVAIAILDRIRMNKLDK